MSETNGGFAMKLCAYTTPFVSSLGILRHVSQISRTFIHRVRPHAIHAVSIRRCIPCALFLPTARFPEYWPTYCPAPKLADWLESYAKNMELNVWTSSQPVEIKQLENNKWHVKVRRGDGSERSFTVDHVVFALGVGAGKPNIPIFKGRVSWM